MLVEQLQIIFKEAGLKEIFIDEYGSITACFKGNTSGPKILFDAHIDVVPVTDAIKWHHNPFGGDIEDGKIYGRGASDMKGSLTAMIVAASAFIEKNGNNFKGEIYISGVVHEECFEGVAARKISKRIKPDFVVIGEASELNIKCGQRGRAEIVIEVVGKSAHSANPDKGINAVQKMMRLLNEVEKLELPSNDFLGKGIMVLTDIISSPYPGASVVPNYCKVTFDRRLLVGETAEEVLNPIKRLINEMKKVDHDFRANVFVGKASQTCYTGSTIQGKRFFQHG